MVTTLSSRDLQDIINGLGFLIPPLLEQRDKIIEYIVKHDLTMDTFLDLWYKITDGNILPPTDFIFSLEKDPEALLAINDKKENKEDKKTTYENKLIKEIRDHKQKIETEEYKYGKTLKAIRLDAISLDCTTIDYNENVDDNNIWTDDRHIARTIRIIKKLEEDKDAHVIMYNINGFRFSRSIREKKKMFGNNIHAFEVWKKKMAKATGFPISDTAVKYFHLSHDLAEEYHWMIFFTRYTLFSIINRTRGGLKRIREILEYVQFPKGPIATDPKIRLDNIYQCPNYYF